MNITSYIGIPLNRYQESEIIELQSLLSEDFEKEIKSSIILKLSEMKIL